MFPKNENIFSYNIDKTKSMDELINQMFGGVHDIRKHEQSKPIDKDNSQETITKIEPYVIATNNALHIYYEFPGATKDAIDVSINGYNIKIVAKYQAMGFKWYDVNTEVKIGSKFDVSKISVNLLYNGLLQINVPLKQKQQLMEEQSYRTIPINQL